MTEGKATAPLMRARQLRSIIEHIARLPEPTRSTVRAALDAATVAQIDASFGVDWLPLELEIGLTRAITRVLGPAEAHRFFLAHQLAAMQGPLFKTLLDSATALFGLDPGSWARWIPRAWNTVFRNCGRWEIERTGPGEVDLTLVELPPEGLADEVWLRSLASSFSALVPLAKREGEFAFDGVERGRSAARFRLRWRPP